MPTLLPRCRLGNVVLQWVHVTAAGVWVGGLAWLLLGLRGRGGAGAGERRERLLACRHGDARGRTAHGPREGAGRDRLRAGALLDQFRGHTARQAGTGRDPGRAGGAQPLPLGAGRGQDQAGARALLLNSRGELIVAAAVLAATAVLSSLVPANAPLRFPPDSDRARRHPLGEQDRRHDAGQAQRRAGGGRPDTYSVQVADYATGAPLAAVSAVQLAFFYQPRPAVASTTLDLRRQTGGTWRGAGFQLSLAGRWTIFVIVERGINSVEARAAAGRRASGQVK